MEFNPEIDIDIDLDSNSVSSLPSSSLYSSCYLPHSQPQQMRSSTSPTWSLLRLPLLLIRDTYPPAYYSSPSCWHRHLNYCSPPNWIRTKEPPSLPSCFRTEEPTPPNYPLFMWLETFPNSPFPPPPPPHGPRNYHATPRAVMYSLVPTLVDEDEEDVPRKAMKQPRKKW